MHYIAWKVKLGILRQRLEDAKKRSDWDEIDKIGEEIDKFPKRPTSGCWMSYFDN